MSWRARLGALPPRRHFVGAGGPLHPPHCTRHCVIDISARAHTQAHPQPVTFAECGEDPSLRPDSRSANASQEISTRSRIDHLL
eukprot:577566-Pyramimonas_sp.AAC.1